MHLVNKLGQFNREKTPERVVHARGMTAKGYFQVTAKANSFSTSYYAWTEVAAGNLCN